MTIYLPIYVSKNTDKVRQFIPEVFRDLHSCKAYVKEHRTIEIDNILYKFMKIHEQEF